MRKILMIRSSKIRTGLLAAALTYLTLTAIIGAKHHGDKESFSCHWAAHR